MRFTRTDRTRTGYFGTRDAAWHNRPDVRSVKAFHAACNDGHAACSADIVIDDSTLTHATALKVGSVCARRACMAEWISGGKSGERDGGTR